jgi:hypothetical protein
MVVIVVYTMLRQTKLQTFYFYMYVLFFNQIGANKILHSNIL